MKAVVALMCLFFTSLSYAMVPFTDEELSNIYGQSIVITVQDTSPEVQAAFDSASNVLNQSIHGFANFIPQNWNIHVTIDGISYPNGVSAVTVDPVTGITTVVIPNFKYIEVKGWLPGTDPGTLSFIGIDSHGSTLKIQTR